MKTRVMQNEPDEPATPKASAVGDAGANHMTHFAARMGRWSASHWKTAVFGWLALRRCCPCPSACRSAPSRSTRPTRTSASPAPPTGSSRDAGFAVDKNGKSTEEQGEMVLIQSKTLTAKDPAFQGRDRRRRRTRSSRSRR